MGFEDGAAGEDAPTGLSAAADGVGAEAESEDRDDEWHWDPETRTLLRVR